MRMIDDVFHVRIMGVERSDGEWGTRLTFMVHDGFNTRVDLDTNMLGVGAMLLRPLYAWCKKHGVERTGRAKLENNDSYPVTGVLWYAVPVRYDAEGDYEEW